MAEASISTRIWSNWVVLVIEFWFGGACWSLVVISGEFASVGVISLLNLFNECLACLSEFNPLSFFSFSVRSA